LGPKSIKRVGIRRARNAGKRKLKKCGPGHRSGLKREALKSTC